MGAFVECHVEILPLLPDVCDASVRGCFLEFGGRGADFAVDDCVFEGGAGGYGAVQGVFS